MRWFVFVFLALTACAASVNVPQEFVYQPITAGVFQIASWQKITDPNQPFKIYIEGDGNAFNARGLPTSDPTPKGHLVRDMAFNDPSANVIYLARPCQYISSSICSLRHWTTARFAPEIINSMHAAIKQIADEKPVILIGFSGGAQIAGLIASAKTGLNIKKIVTIAGNLDHLAWTSYHQLPPLNESMNLENYRNQFLKIDQIHYVGSNDNVIPPALVHAFIGDQAPVIEVKGAAHNQGWNRIYSEIYQFK